MRLLPCHRVAAWDKMPLFPKLAELSPTNVRAMMIANKTKFLKLPLAFADIHL